MKLGWKILDYFFLLRPTGIFPSWTLLLAGRICSGTEFGITAVFIAYGALMGACYTINQIVDIEGDRINSKLYLIADQYIRRDTAAVFAGALMVLGWVWFFYLNAALGVLGIIVVVVVGGFYNFKPFRWKDRPFGVMVVSMAAGEIAFLIGGYPDISLALIYKSIPYLTAVAAVAALTTIPDVKGDESVGKNTIALKYGHGTTTLFAVLLCTVSALLGWWNQDRIIFWSALLSLPLFINGAFRADRSSSVLAVKYSLVIISLAVGLRYPGYLLFIVLYFFFSRWYYRRRFNIEYPSFNAK